MNNISDFLDHSFLLILDPGSRIYYLNLLGSIGVILIYWRIKKGSISVLNLKKWFFCKKYWWNKSTRTDYKLFILNATIKTFLFLPIIGLSFSFSSATITAMEFVFDDFLTISSTTLNIILATFFVFMWDDFLRFFHHYWMHKSKWLWQLHKVHHSAKILTPITLFRIHPVESLMATLRNALSAGVSTGVLLFIFDSQFHLATLMGANAFVFGLGFLVGNLRHSHIPLSFGVFEHVLISPRQHQIHHSTRPQHLNRNFGTWLSIWDKMMGSFYSETCGISQQMT